MEVVQVGTLFFHACLGVQDLTALVELDIAVFYLGIQVRNHFFIEHSEFLEGCHKSCEDELLLLELIDDPVALFDFTLEEKLAVYQPHIEYFLGQELDFFG